MADIVKILINIIAGSALIIYGALLLSGSMEVKAEKKTRQAFMLFKTPCRAFFASVLLTSIVQSSTAVTVFTVSMANAGALGLTSAMAAVYGANIGTTVTAQLMSVDASRYGPYMLAAGIICWLVFRALGKSVALPKALTGLGMLFIGLSILKSSAAIIKSSGYVMNFIELYSGSAFWCVFFGFTTTALVHSSSATIGLTIAMHSAGVLGFRQAALITLGDNIGTCVTAQIAATAGSVAGRRVAWGNSVYNIISSLLAILFLDTFTGAVIYVTALLGQPGSNLVANAHTLMNIIGAMVFLPLNGAYCRLLELFVTDEKDSRKRQFVRKDFRA